MTAPYVNLGGGKLSWLVIIRHRDNPNKLEKLYKSPVNADRWAKYYTTMYPETWLESIIELEEV